SPRTPQHRQVTTARTIHIQMSSVLFYDPVCQQPYDTRTLHTQAMGGTESTLVRVADALGAWGMQHNRTHDWQRGNRPERLAGITHAVLNRASSGLPSVRELCEPGARLSLCLHARLHPHSRRARWMAAPAPLLRQSGATAVCVSDWQRAGVEAALR